MGHRDDANGRMIQQLKKMGVEANSIEPLRRVEGVDREGLPHFRMNRVMEKDELLQRLVKNPELFTDALAQTRDDDSLDILESSIYRDFNAGKFKGSNGFARQLGMGRE